MNENIKSTCIIECELSDWLQPALVGKQPEAAQPATKSKSIAFPSPREMTDPMGVYTEQLAEYIKAAGNDGRTRQEINKAFRFQLTNNAQRDMALSKLSKGFEKRNERYQASDIMWTRHRWSWVGE